MTNNQNNSMPQNITRNVLIFLISIIVAGVIGLSNSAPPTFYYFLLAVAGVLLRIILSK